MKTTKALWAARCAGVRARRRRRRAERADQRRRRDVPVPDLLEVVRRVQQAAPERRRSTTSRSARAAASGRSRNQTVFFGATDGPMTDEQLQAAPGKILHFPTVLGAVVPVYNIPNVNAELKFTGPVLADIFLGKITKWNDPAIAKLNAGVHAAGDRHHRRAPLRRLGHDLHLGGLPVEGVAGVEDEGRRRTPRSTGRPASAARATRASPASSRRRPARSATSS